MKIDKKFETKFNIQKNVKFLFLKTLSIRVPFKKNMIIDKFLLYFLTDGVIAAGKACHILDRRLKRPNTTLPCSLWTSHSGSTDSFSPPACLNLVKK